MSFENLQKMQRICHFLGIESLKDLQQLKNEYNSCELLTALVTQYESVLQECNTTLLY